jgi:hypothetical protein
LDRELSGVCHGEILNVDESLHENPNTGRNSTEKVDCAAVPSNGLNACKACKACKAIETDADSHSAAKGATVTESDVPAT